MCLYSVTGISLSVFWWECFNVGVLLIHSIYFVVFTLLVNLVPVSFYVDEVYPLQCFNGSGLLFTNLFVSRGATT